VGLDAESRGQRHQSLGDGAVSALTVDHYADEESDDEDARGAP